MKPITRIELGREEPLYAQHFKRADDCAMFCCGLAVTIVLTFCAARLLGIL
jgi:hypothetical protein